MTFALLMSITIQEKYSIFLLAITAVLLLS